MKRLIVLGLVLINSLLFFAQKRLAEFPFDTHNKAININSAIGISTIRIKTSSLDAIVQAPDVVLDTDVNSLFFQFNTNYNPTTNNINIAIAPKLGNNVKITHIEYSIRFGSVNSGNAGFFISKDPELLSNTQLWTCGNNKTFNIYKDFIIKVPDSNISYSESTTDSIRFVIAYGGTNNLGMYIDNIVIYGIVNDEKNTVQNIAVNALNTSKELAFHPSGANVCWLMDSDIKWPRTVSNESRFAEMKFGAMRFPYGHLADNYLWHSPGQYSTVATTGPKPKTASPETPSNLTWAVNTADNTFRKDLSFDEFIAICKRQNIEPLICVNSQAHFYTGGPTYEVLKTSAAEWVRYANITKGYGIKYWQLGNEIEHDGNLKMSEYTNLFIDFATAMKAIDPTIKVGTGVLSNTTWNKDILTKAGTLCDFVATHNYQFNSKLALGGYRSWYKDYSTVIQSVEATQEMLDNNFPNRPEIEMHITETNVTGGDFPDVSNIDLYKSLYWFEMNMNELAQKNVKYTYCWGTHSPWGGERSLGDIGCLLENSNANTIRPAGRVIQLINTYLKNKWVVVTRVLGYLRFYASVSTDRKELSVFILNKNLYTENTKLNISSFDLTNAQVEQTTFSGTDFNDKYPVINTVQLSSVPSQVELPPVSLTILNYKIKENTGISIEKEDNLKLSFDGNNLHISILSNAKGKINIYNVNGQKIVERSIEKETKTINLTKLNEGVYIVNLRSGSSTKTIKIIK